MKWFLVLCALFLVLCALFLVGCSSPQELSREIIVTGWDFRECNNNNFMVTPEPPTGKYESIGLFTVEIYPSVIEVKPGMSIDKKNWIPLQQTISMTGSRWCYERISSDSVLNILYKKASSIGANAFTHFRTENKFYMNGNMTIPYWEIIGYAIKRE
jgi:hypothetical protein